MSQKYDVFISYSSRDRAMAEKLAIRLREAGLSLFFDRWCLPGGKPWGPLLEQSIQESGACAVLIDKEGFGLRQAREMWAALGRQARDPDFPVIPTLLPGAEEVPSLFLGLNTWVDMRRGVHDEAAFKLLLQAIRGEAMGGPVFEELAEAVRPYLGLRAFREEDSAFFLGRETFTERLVGAVERTPFLAVVGPSGSGKSSVVQAGLIPALRKGALDGSKAWEFAIFRPGRNPLKQLAAPLVSLLEPEMDEVTRLAKVGELADYLREDQVSLADAVRRILEKQPGTERLVLVADQFEELFTYQESEPEREVFLGHLLGAAEERDGPLAVILTLRADFYSHCLGIRPLADRLEGRVVNIGPMTEEELRRAIEEPARSVGVRFEAGLVERVLEDARGEPGALPLLEFALTELWEKRRGGLLIHEAYKEFGGIGGAIAQRAEKVSERFSEEEKGLARRIFLNLVTPGEETEDVRRRAALAEILPDEPGRAGEVRAVVKALADARLITTGREEASGEEIVELAHEALIRGWGRLRGWLGKDREFLLWQQRLRVALAEWERTKYDEGALLRGAPLAEAERWLAERETRLSPAERSFIQESVALRERETAEREARHQRELEASRRWTIRLGAVSLTAIILAGIASWVYGNAQQAWRDAQHAWEAAQSRALAATAMGQLDSDLELGLLLAIEAVETECTVQAEEALRQAVASPWRATLRGHVGSVNSAAYSPDGRWIVTASSDKTAQVWDTGSGHQMMVLQGHAAPVFSAIYSPDGQWIVTASSDKTARVWDAESGQQKMVLRGHQDSVLSAAYSPDGRWIVTASLDRTARVWDVESGQQRVVLQHPLVVRERTMLYSDAEGEKKMTQQEHVGSVLSAAYSPDGRWIVTASSDETVRVWDAESGQQEAELTHTDWVYSVVYSPDGQWIVTASSDGTVRVWNAESGQQKMELEHQGVQSAAYSPDGRWIVTASEDDTARVWDAENGQQMVVLQHPTFVNSVVNSAAYSPDGRWIVTAGWDRTVRVWEAKSGQPQMELQVHTSDVYSAAYSPDGRRIVTASQDGMARVWDAESGQQEMELEHPVVRSAAYSPDGRRIVTAGGFLAATRVWDAQSGQQVMDLEHYSNSAAYSPDGQRIVTASWDKTARVWDAASGQQKMVLKHMHNVSSAVYSPDGRQILTVSEGGPMLVWDAASGRPKMELQDPLVQSAVYSPDGRWIATADFLGVARVWNAESGQQQMVLKGHTNVLHSVAYSPDGRWILTTGNDQTARVWDAESGQQKMVLNHPARVLSAAYSPSGQWIVTASSDGTVRIWWWGDTEDLLAEARSRLTRELTCQERVQYLHEDLDCGAGE